MRLFEKLLEREIWRRTRNAIGIHRSLEEGNKNLDVVTQR